MRTLVAGFSVALCLVAFHNHAGAFTYTNCNGAVTWHQYTPMWMDNCSAPNGSAAAQAQAAAGFAWNNMSTTIYGRFNWQEIFWNSGCTWNNNDGHNEFALVTRASISGLNGITIQRIGSCFFSAAEWLEGDVLLANDMNFANEDESFLNWTNAQQGQVVIAHELGHFVGLGHYESFDIMRRATPYPLAGGAGDMIGGRGWHGVAFPDDAAGARFLYPGNPVTNIFASAQQFSGSAVSATMASTTINRCRGDAFFVTYTVVNNGTTNVLNYGFRIYLTQTPGVSGGGTNIFTSATAGSNAQNYWTESRTLFVPAGLPNGLYWIQWQVDTANSYNEILETDNFVRAATTINVGC